MSNILNILSECDKEQIQFTETIQSFGALFVTDRSSIIVACAVGSGFDVTSEDMIGKHLQSFFGENYERLYDAVEDRIEPSPPFLIRDKKRNFLTCIAYQHGELTVFEIERVPETPVSIPSIEFIRESGGTLEAYLSLVANNLHEISGFDRIMIYKFSNDWHGEVVAESVHGSAKPLIGHHFPASDIPVPARNLFLKVWVRVICNVNESQVPILGVGREVDLSRSILRSSAAVHLQYLRNMGVEASMTLSIICDGKLWGLVACHHFTPRYLTGEQRSLCSLVAKFLSARTTTLLIEESDAASERVSVFLEKLGRHRTLSGFHEAIRECKIDLLKFIGCDGFTFVGIDHLISAGRAPTSEQTRALVQKLDEGGRHIVSTEAIRDEFPSLVQLQSVAAGITAIKVGQVWLIWNRHQTTQSYKWAGDPAKPVQQQNGTVKLTPRASFESWRKVIQGKSLEWQPYELDAAIRLADQLGSDSQVKTKTRTEYLEILQASIDRHKQFLKSEFNNPVLGAPSPGELTAVGGA